MPEHRIRLAASLQRAAPSILQAPHPLLARMAAPVVAFDAELRDLAAQMLAVLADPAYRQGVGLAAPQFGVLRRVVVVQMGRQGVPLVLVNPVLSAQQGHAGALEGCLSVHEVESYVERATRVRVDAHDQHGRPLHLKARDLLARVLQHEVDHLDGRTILDVGEQASRHR